MTDTPTIKTTADEIIVKFDYFRECNALKEYCDKINQSNLEISWFKDKVLWFEFESEEEFKKRKSFLSTDKEMQQLMILDVGCGIGRILNFYFNVSNNIFGVDFSTSMLKYMQK